MSSSIPTARHPFLGDGAPLAIVHRGGASEALENTRAAFEQAVGQGFRWFETDVRATSDGVLLAFHDATLGRVTDRDGTVSELPWSEVGQARVGGREPIPRLEDLLAEFPNVRFNLDAKDVSVLRPLARLLAGNPDGDLLDRVCLASFGDVRLAWLRTALGARLCTSLGPREILGLKRAAVRGRAYAPPPGARCVQVPPGPPRLRLVDRRFVATAHAAGLDVHVWTIDEEAAMDRLLDLGVDGIMTDRPTVLRQVLERRGQWAGEPGP